MAALELNELVMRTARRAENAPEQLLEEAFVPVPSLLAQLDTSEHQVLFGRRGTGKTHLLRHLQSTQTASGALAVYLDLRKIGASGDVFSRQQEDFAELATGLLVDVVEHVHGQIYDRVLTEEWSADVDAVSLALDRLAEAATQIRVVGDVEVAQEHESTSQVTRSVSAEASIGTDPRIAWRIDSGKDRAARRLERRLDRGREVHHVLLGPLSTAFQQLAAAMRPHPIWLLIDEWSALPLELQPVLADLLRRTVFATTGIAVKISAIHGRSRFAETWTTGYTVGLELGADTAATLDLDDFLLFRNDIASTLGFYAALLHHHLAAMASGNGRRTGDDHLMRAVAGAQTPAKLTRLVFDTADAFHALVLGAEGVPRDLLQIVGLAAGIAYDQPISTGHVTEAARNFFLRDKEPLISKDARAVFAHLVEECVRQKTRVIPLRREGESDDELIRRLYDARVIHRVKQGMSLNPSRPTELYDVYVVDSGAFLGLPAAGKARARYAALDPAARFADASEIETRVHITTQTTPLVPPTRQKLSSRRNHPPCAMSQNECRTTGFASALWDATACPQPRFVPSAHAASSAAMAPWLAGRSTFCRQLDASVRQTRVT